jgi:hypothetical protein
VIVGAPGYNSDTGRAYIFHGGSSMDSTPDVTLTGENTGDKFGYSTHYAGDIDGDTDPDVIVGAPYYDNGSDTDSGVIYIFCGGSDMDTTADYTRFGESPGDHFGWSVSFAGDLNGDGYHDTLTGAPYYNTLASESPPSAPDAGKIYVNYNDLTIPEFSIIFAPIICFLIIIIIIRKKRKLGYKNV